MLFAEYDYDGRGYLPNANSGTKQMKTILLWIIATAAFIIFAFLVRSWYIRFDEFMTYQEIRNQLKTLSWTLQRQYEEHGRAPLADIDEESATDADVEAAWTSFLRSTNLGDLSGRLSCVYGPRTRMYWTSTRGDGRDIDGRYDVGCICIVLVKKPGLPIISYCDIEPDDSEDEQGRRIPAYLLMANGEIEVVSSWTFVNAK